MALRQKQDRLIMPRPARVLARAITLCQSLDAQMIRHMRHGSPPAIHGARLYLLRLPCGIPSESITRKPYHMPDAFIRPDPSLLPLERPRCSKCQGRMMLAHIE